MELKACCVHEEDQQDENWSIPPSAGQDVRTEHLTILIFILLPQLKKEKNWKQQGIKPSVTFVGQEYDHYEP